MRFLSVLFLTLTTTTLALELNIGPLQVILNTRQDTSTTPSSALPTSRTANTETIQSTATTTESTSSTRFASTNDSGSAPMTPTTTTGSAMIAVAAPLRTNDVRWPAAGVGLAAVAIGMGML